MKTTDSEHLPIFFISARSGDFLKCGNRCVFAALMAIAILLSVCTVCSGEQPVENYPPFFIRKTDQGSPFFNFNLVDIEEGKWKLSDMAGKPVIMITGGIDLRYDLRQWALDLKRKFADPGLVHLLWIVNLGRSSLTEHYAKAVKVWKNFRPPIPVVIDTHSQVGRSLRIDYDIPNIICIDAEGKLRFHEMRPWNKSSSALIHEMIAGIIRTGRD